MHRVIFQIHWNQEGGLQESEEIPITGFRCCPLAFLASGLVDAARVPSYIPKGLSNAHKGVRSHTAVGSKRSLKKLKIALKMAGNFQPSNLPTSGKF